MSQPSQGWLVGAAVAAQLLTAGCGDGLGVFGSLFSGSGGSSEGSTSGFDGGGSAALETGAGGGGGGLGVQVATLHNPEPASMALFGGGLAGIALLRRRKARRRCGHSS